MTQNNQAKPNMPMSMPTPGLSQAPVQSAPIKISDQEVLKLKLTIAQINKILAIIGKEPLAEVIELFMAIRQQSDQQVADKAAAIQNAGALDDTPKK